MIMPILQTFKLVMEILSNSTGYFILYFVKLLNLSLV